MGLEKCGNRINTYKLIKNNQITKTGWEESEMRIREYLSDWSTRYSDYCHI